MDYFAFEAVKLPRSRWSLVILIVRSDQKCLFMSRDRDTLHLGLLGYAIIPYIKKNRDLLFYMQFSDDA